MLSAKEKPAFDSLSTFFELNVVAMITLDAVNSLKLKVGDQAYAVIKASSVMVAID